MSRRRVHAGEFIKLLESAAQPLYVLDDSLTIVFMNEACRAWVGGVADELLGQACLYDSGEQKSAVEGVAAALCPPPAVLEGREVTAAVAHISAEQASFRAARFVPLRWAGGPVLCIIAIVDPHDSPRPTVEIETPGLDESQDLHLRLQRFRQQRRLRFAGASVVGVTPAARRAAAQAELAAGTRANVLLLGPPGSGLRHLAEAIHYGGHSGRKVDSPALADRSGMADATQRPARTGTGPLLVPLECGLLDADLLQSTLRAAWAAASGVPAERVGGTILLYDVDRLPMEAQAALVTALSSPNSPWRAIATAATALVDWRRGGCFAKTWPPR